MCNVERYFFGRLEFAGGRSSHQMDVVMAPEGERGGTQDVDTQQEDRRLFPFGR